MKKRIFIIITVLLICFCSSMLLINAENIVYDNTQIEISQDRVTKAYVGECVKIASVKALYPDKVKNISVSVINVKESSVIEVKNNSFTPLKKGKYKVCFGVEPTNGEIKLYNYEVEVALSDNPIITGEVSLPYAFLEGKEYIIPQISSIDYAVDGLPKDVKKQIFYQYVMDSKKEIVGGKFIPYAKNSGDKVKLIFVSSSQVGQGETVKIYEVPIVKHMNEQGYDFSKLFYTHNISNVISTENYIEFSTIETNANMSFANYLNAKFSLAFQIPKEANAFGGVVLNLVDSQNSDIECKFEITKNPNDRKNSLISINDGAQTFFSGSFYEESSYVFQFDYDNSQKNIVDASGKVIGTIAQDINGKIFNGFPSGKVKFKIEFTKVVGSAAIQILRVNLQTISSFNKDEVKPVINIDKNMKFVYLLDSNVTLESVTAIDVVDNNPSTLIEVRDSFGNFVTDINGLQLKSVDGAKRYTFLPKTLGDYVLTYTAKDASDNRTKAKRIISIIEKIAPKLNISGSLPDSININEKIIIPKALPFDNLTARENLKLLISLVYPNGTVRVVSNGESLQLTVKGNHYIRFVVYDDYYNFDFAEYIVNVI